MALQRSVKPQFLYQQAAPQISSQETYADFTGRSSSSSAPGGSRSHTQLPSLAAIISLCLGLIVFTTWTLIKDSAVTSINQHHLRSSSAGKKYLYWGPRIDCPGRNCLICGGLGHQESSLRCALEEAVFLNRTFVLPSKLCLTTKHNAKLQLGQSTSVSSHQLWDSESSSVESLYDIDLLSKTTPVILDSSTEWDDVLKLADRSIVAQAHVQGISKEELQTKYQDFIIINRTANPLAWFMECKNRRKHNALLVPYSLLPAVAAQSLQEVAQKGVSYLSTFYGDAGCLHKLGVGENSVAGVVQIIKKLGDYDGLHVRRGDKVKLRKDRFGVYRTAYPHLDRDTQPQAILDRIKGWIPEGRTLYIASDERKRGFFDPLAERYQVVRPFNFSTLLGSVVHNNYQLFMIDRLILAGAKVLVKTWREYPEDLCLSEDSKKALKRWEIPVNTFNESQRHPML